MKKASHQVAKAQSQYLFEGVVSRRSEYVFSLMSTLCKTLCCVSGDSGQDYSPRSGRSLSSVRLFLVIFQPDAGLFRCGGDPTLRVW